MNGASVVNEVEAGPGVAGEEFGGQQVAFQAITGAARSNEIAWRVDAALSQGKDVIDSVDVETISPRGKGDAPQRESFPWQGVA